MIKLYNTEKSTFKILKRKFDESKVEYKVFRLNPKFSMNKSFVSIDGEAMIYERALYWLQEMEIKSMMFENFSEVIYDYFIYNTLPKM